MVDLSRGGGNGEGRGGEGNMHLGANSKESTDLVEFRHLPRGYQLGSGITACRFGYLGL